MKKAAIALLMLLGLSLQALAGSKTLKKVMTLKINHKGGANGANVAWHPDNQKYYAAMAGNTYFPMVVYDQEGKIVSDSTLETMFDVRGLWYNPNTKTLQSNGYDDFGLAEYRLDNKGIPVSVKKITTDSKQPDAQSTGAYDATGNAIYYFDHGKVQFVRQDLSGATTTIDIHLGVKKKKKINDEGNSKLKKDYNENACVYTGIKNGEIGILNVTDRQIELYNAGTGLMKKAIKLPSDAPVETSLNFCYANGIYWLFEKKKREWRGYQ